MKDKIRKIIPRCIYIKICKTYDTIRYLFNKSKYNKITKEKYKIYSDEKTIELIISKRKSIARFGDGEFKWILGEKQESFQDDSKELSERLKEVLTNPLEDLLIGIPYSINNVYEYNHGAKKYWVNFFSDYYEKIKDYLNRKNNYCNACITRPYIDYKEKKSSKKKFENLKKIWNKRKLVIIEGENTKMGINNNLLDNAKSIERIICPAKNAFEKYNEILKYCKKIEKDKLILISLGPTATVLAYDLTKEGYQAIDTGHIDIEYEWYLRNSKKKEAVTGKEVNEASYNKKRTNIETYGFEQSIIKKII